MILRHYASSFRLSSPISCILISLFSLFLFISLPPSAFASPDANAVEIIQPLPAASPVLRAALVVTRHGDRTPIKTFPNTKSHWPEGLGQLTWLGMEQHYELGQMFRKRYVDEHRLVNPEYRGSEVYVRSTSKERTLMSAQSFMHGFYPPTHEVRRLPGGLQPVPVHAFAKHQDIVLYAYKNCPRLKDMQSLVKQGKEWRETEEKTAELRATLSQLFGAEIGVKHFTSLATLLRQEIVHNKTMIDGMSAELLPAIKSMGEWVLRQKYATREMGSLGSGKVFEEILTLMRPHLPLGKPAKDSAKFVLLSAHDGTLLALLTALGVPNFPIPPFAAYLAFELYTWPNDHEGERAFVKVIYNNEPLGLPGCESDGHCSFADFERLLRESTSPNWYAACGTEICFEKDVLHDDFEKKDKDRQTQANENQTDGEQAKKKRKVEDDSADIGADGKKEHQVTGLGVIMLAAGLVLGFSAVPLKNRLFPSTPANPKRTKIPKGSITNNHVSRTPPRPPGKQT